MILLAGGCVVATAGSGMGVIGLINLLIIVPNALMIAAIYGFSGPMRAVFVTFAVIDVAVALLVGGLTLSLPGGDQGVVFIGLLITFAFLLKAGLSWRFRRVKA